MRPQTASNNRAKHPFEIFESVQGTDKVADRVRILQENESYELKTILQAAFRPDIKLDLPAGAPPYTPSPNPAGVNFSPLRKQIDVLPRLLVGNNTYDKIKKEMVFIKLLENVHASDAEILIAMKDKKLHKKYSLLTSSLIKKAFPNLGIE
jgi:hypothetical protein